MKNYKLIAIRLILLIGIVQYSAIPVYSQNDEQIKKHADRLLLSIKSKDETTYRKLLLDYNNKVTEHQRVSNDKLISNRYKFQYKLNPPDSIHLSMQNDQSVLLFKNLIASLEHLKVNFQKLQLINYGYSLFRTNEISVGVFEISHFSMILFDGNQYIKLASTSSNPLYVNFKIFGGAFDSIHLLDNTLETTMQYIINIKGLDSKLPNLEPGFEESRN